MAHPDFSDWELDPAFGRPDPVDRLYPQDYESPSAEFKKAGETYSNWSSLVSRGGHLLLPWAPVSNLVGPLLPGWLVLFGGRAKGGKSTFLRSIFHSWVTDFNRRILYVGTEQNAGILRALWACLRLGLPTEAAIDPSHAEHSRILADVQDGQAHLAERAMVVAELDMTLDSLTRWGRVAWKEKFDVLILDHFHRIADTGPSQARSRNSQIQHLKNIAAKSNLLILVAAQLKNGEGRLLGEYEVPGSDSWSETSGLRKECDVALQGWRPFLPGVTKDQKQEARDNPAKLEGLVQPNVMAVRCDAHRYRNVPPHLAARLYVDDGELTSYRV